MFADQTGGWGRMIESADCLLAQRPSDLAGGGSKDVFDTPRSGPHARTPTSHHRTIATFSDRHHFDTFITFN
jgi:hypothetical protein